MLDAPLLFPFQSYWWLYAAFIAFVVLMLALDLGVFHRKAHVVGFSEAATWSAIWVVLALLFNLGFYYYALWVLPGAEHLAAFPGFDASAAATRVGLEFLTGYVVEKSLAVDNIFVFVVVFSYRDPARVSAPHPVLRHHRSAHFSGDIHRARQRDFAVSHLRNHLGSVPVAYRHQDSLRTGKAD
jgi:hypothetical protein